MKTSAHSNALVIANVYNLNRKKEKNLYNLFLATCIVTYNNNVTFSHQYP